MQSGPVPIPQAGRGRLDIMVQWPRGADGPFHRTAITSSCNAHTHDHTINPIPSARIEPDLRITERPPPPEGSNSLTNSDPFQSENGSGLTRHMVQRSRRTAGPRCRTAITSMYSSCTRRHKSPSITPDQAGSRKPPLPEGRRDPFVPIWAIWPDGPGEAQHR
jgi:hypothetical protein